MTRVLIMLLLAAPLQAQTLTGALKQASRCAGLQASPVVATWAGNFARVLGREVTQGNGSVAATPSAIDSTQGALGPIFLDHARTIGAGHWNANVLTQTGPFSDYDGMDLSHLTGPGAIVLERVDGAAVAAQLDYDIAIRSTAAGLSLTYGVTDALDLSLLLPIVHLEADIAGTNTPVFTLSDMGRFRPIPQRDRTTFRSREVLSVTGVSDMTLRAKYQLPPHWAATLAVQFPTGNPDDGLGTGDYWLSPGIAGAWRFWDWLELNVNLRLNLDLNTINASEVHYGIGLSEALWPRRLAGIVEFLGRTQLGANAFALDTGTLFLLPTGTLDTRSFLGMDYGRRDFFTLVFGVRAVLPLGLMLFAAGVVSLNNSDLQARAVTPVAGIGASF